LYSTTNRCRSPLRVVVSFVKQISTGHCKEENSKRWARRRYQDPDPELVGSWWYIRVYRDEYVNGRRIRKTKTHQAGLGNRCPFERCRKLKAEYLRSLNQGLISEGAATAVRGVSWKNVYLITELPRMASTTQDRYRGIVTHYLIPTFGSVCLRDMTSLALQKYILGFRIEEPEDRGLWEASGLAAWLSLVSPSIRSGMCCPAFWDRQSNTGSS